MSKRPKTYEEELEQAYQRSLNFLTFRARSVDEMRKYLARRGYEESVIDETLSRLAGIGLLDDEAFAGAWIASRAAAKGYGPRRLKNELLKKGVKGETIDEKIEEVYEPGADPERVYGMAERRLASMRGVDAQAARRRLTQFLLNKGFDYDTVKDAVAQAMKGFGD